MENPLFAAIFTNDDNANTKLSHDSYHVFVNGDFVGNKVLVAQSEQVNDVDTYLQHNGFDDFKSKLEGDHLLIEMPDSEQSEAVKKQLNAYLSIR